MGFEGPPKAKQPSAEEMAKIEKARTISDAELLKGGAEYKINESGEKRLEATVGQEKLAEREMQQKAAEEMMSGRESSSSELREEDIETIERERLAELVDMIRPGDEISILNKESGNLEGGWKISKFVGNIGNTVLVEKQQGEEIKKEGIDLLSILRENKSFYDGKYKGVMSELIRGGLDEKKAKEKIREDKNRILNEQMRQERLEILMEEIGDRKIFSPNDVEIIEKLENKLEEYRMRPGNDARAKYEVAYALLSQTAVDRRDIRNFYEDILKDLDYEEAAQLLLNAFNVIEDYVKTGGVNIKGGTGLRSAEESVLGQSEEKERD